mmetsp:Transcript_9887/g.24642  ORF Transcript_9887/g.24642 Transcript_9887/m.24642 type:complete len:217 (-) Transcript_9887:204-854(-)
MIRTWQPQNRAASHSMESRENILQGDKNSVSHMEASSDVGRRHGQDVWFPATRVALLLGLLRIGLEATRRFPPLVNIGFKFRRGVVSKALFFVFNVVCTGSFRNGRGLFFSDGRTERRCCSPKRILGECVGIFVRGKRKRGPGKRSAGFLVDVAASNKGRKSGVCGGTEGPNTLRRQGRRDAKECSCRHCLLCCVPVLLGVGSFGCEQLIRHSGSW